MRLNDLLSGLLIALVGAIVLVHVQSFPAPGDQPAGPAFFPGLIGLGLVGGGSVLMWAGWRERAAGWVQWEPALRQPRALVRFATVAGTLIFYALVVDTMGFLPTAFALLAALFLAFEVRPRWIVPLAAGTALALHLVFYTGLRVPLPWGWLEAYAW
jgi:putative tricarboxylic transport membrane protein